MEQSINFYVKKKKRNFRSWWIKLDFVRLFHWVPLFLCCKTDKTSLENLGHAYHILKALRLLSHLTFFSPWTVSSHFKCNPPGNRHKGSTFLQSRQIFRKAQRWKASKKNKLMVNNEKSLTFFFLKMRVFGSLLVCDVKSHFNFDCIAI